MILVDWLASDKFEYAESSALIKVISSELTDFLYVAFWKGLKPL
jgi:hypothetical protein